MNIYIHFISAVGSIINGLFITFLGIDATNNQWVTSLATLFGRGKSVVFLENIELFSIWTVILSGFGLIIVGRIPKGLAWGTVIILFILSVGFSSIVGYFQ